MFNIVDVTNDNEFNINNVENNIKFEYNAFRRIISVNIDGYLHDMFYVTILNLTLN